MEVDFDSLDRIVNLVSKPTPTLTVKHVIQLTRTNPTNKREKIGYAFKYDTTPQNKYVKPVSGLYFQGYPSIQLVGVPSDAISTDGNEPTKAKKRNVKCVLDTKNFIPFLAMLDVGYNWLAGNLYNKTFLLDETGRPFKIKDPFQKEICPLSQTSYVMIRPSILRDASNVRYEGILMMTHEGELTNFTAVEFANFRDQMKSLLPNIYIATSTIINQAMSYSIYSKLKDKR